jgi:hypothetical protein
VSKKEIRRAAREAYPKAKNAPTKKGKTGGVYGKRKVTVGGGIRSTADRSTGRPPSIRRSVITGTVTGFFYFAAVQWILPRFIKGLGDTGIGTNVLVGVIGIFVFTGISYLTDSIRYRRYQRKHKASSK